MTDREKYLKQHMNDAAKIFDPEMTQVITEHQARNLYEIAYWEGKRDCIKENMEFEKDNNKLYYMNLAVQSCDNFIRYFSNNEKLRTE